MQQSDETVPVYIDFLNRFDIESLQITDSELLSAVENGLELQGKAQVSIEPRMHIEPDNDVDGHFNVLRGWIGGSINLAGTKVVGDFVNNYQQNRPSEYGVLTLFDPENGAPKAILDAAGITDMRTGAITALGAKYLPGALLIPYGTMSALDDELPGIVDKFVMDDWGQAFGKFGALRRFIDNGVFNAENLHAELGEIVAGKKPGRQSNSETILFWHRGLSLSDIALGHVMLEKALRIGVGQRLRFY